MSSESFIRLLSQPLAVSVIVCGAVAVALLLFLAYIDVKYYLRVYRFCRKNAEKSETRKKEFLPPVSLIVYACENAVISGITSTTGRRHIKSRVTQNNIDPIGEVAHHISQPISR